MRSVPFVVAAILTIILSFEGLHPFLMAFAAFFLLLFASLALLVMCAEWPSSWGRPRKERSARVVRWTRAIITICVVLTFSVPLTHWPLRLSFSLSKPSLEKMAARVAAGEKIRVPQTVGAFDLTYISQGDDGTVCLWVEGDEDDRGEPAYFVQGPADKVKTEWKGYDVVILDDDWSFVSSM